MTTSFELEEQERYAYITGDIDRAKILAELLDLKQENEMFVRLNLYDDSGS